MQPPHDEVAAFLRGDAAPVGQIRAAIEAVVRRFRLSDGEVDRDLVQEALGRICRNLRAGEFRGQSSLETYAEKIAKYTCLEHLRRKRFEVRMDVELIPSGARWSDPERALLWTEEHARNLKVFASLPEEMRELLRLIFLEGLSYGEIARRLGVSEGTVKSRVHRLRLSCRDAVRSEQGPGLRRGGERVGG